MGCHEPAQEEYRGELIILPHTHRLLLGTDDEIAEGHALAHYAAYERGVVVERVERGKEVRQLTLYVLEMREGHHIAPVEILADPRVLAKNDLRERVLELIRAVNVEKLVEPQVFRDRGECALHSHVHSARFVEILGGEAQSFVQRMLCEGRYFKVCVLCGNVYDIAVAPL